MLRYVYAWRALLALEAPDVLRVRIELQRVISETEGACMNCGTRPPPSG